MNLINLLNFLSAGVIFNSSEVQRSWRKNEGRARYVITFDPIKAGNIKRTWFVPSDSGESNLSRFPYF